MAYAMQAQYVCGVCGYHHVRLRSLMDHLSTKNSHATHPLGQETPYARVEMAPRGACDCSFCTAPVTGLVALPAGGATATTAPPLPPARTDTTPQPRHLNPEMTRDNDRSALVTTISRKFDELSVLMQRLQTWVPAHQFRHEPVPAPRQLVYKLCDMLSGIDGMASHAIWSHVHSCGNVRKMSVDSVADVLMVYGAHGWAPVTASKVAEDAYDELGPKLQRMWFALEAFDSRKLNTVRGAMRAFLAGSPCVPAEPALFGMDDIIMQNVLPATRASVVSRIKMGLLECCE